MEPYDIAYRVGHALGTGLCVALVCLLWLGAKKLVQVVRGKKEDDDEMGEWNGCSDEEAQRIADTPSVPRFLKSDQDCCDCGQTKGNCGPNF